MTWTILAVLFVVLLLIIVLGTRPMKIPREPDREGIEDADAVQAYDRVSRLPLFGIGRRIMLRALMQYRPQGILVDIGCGPGYLTARISRRFPELRVIGLDISDKMLAVARDRWQPRSYPNLEFIMGDAQRLPFPDGTVDFAVSSLSLHHWTDAGTAVREIHRILRPGGQFLIFDLRRDGISFFYYALKLGQAILAPAAIRRTNGAVGSFWSSYTPAELEKILSTVPLRKLKIHPRFGWMLAWGNK